MKWPVISTSVYTAVLFLGLITPVLAEEVRMEYTDPSHLHAPKVVDGVSYEYDANGNLLNDGERVISWNQDNLPTRIEKDGQVVEFFYDANGRRVLKRSGQQTLTYVNERYEQSTINNQQSSTKYYFANGRTAQSVDGALSFLHQDHLGSTVLATNTNSQPTSNSLSYFPYGEEITNHQLGASLSIPSELSITNYLFTGQESDPESDLYNYKARLYNPETGVFISADPVQGLNRYAYVKGNPLRFTDPTGLQAPRRGGGRGRFWRMRSEDEPNALEEPLLAPSVPPPPAAEPDLEEFFPLVNFLKERFPKGLTIGLWTPAIRKEIEESFGVGAAWAIEDSLFQSDALQCVGFARAYTLQTFGVSLPRFGGGPEKVGIAFENFRWHEDMTEVEVGDIFFYQVQKPNGFYNHWAIVSKKGPSGIKLIEAVGAGFRSLGKAPGAILVNERSFDFASGQITGLTAPLEEGLYGFYRSEK